jgi:hypothetical protein
MTKKNPRQGLHSVMKNPLKGSTVGGIAEAACLRARQLTPVSLTRQRAIATVVGIAMLLLPAAVAAQSSTAITEDFSEEQIGAAPTSFSTPSGWWSIGTDGVHTKPVLFEDGTRYAAATSTNSVAEQAQAQAQGQNLHQLADTAAGLAYFPIALFNKVPDFTQGTVVARFAIVGGDLDTEAGIVFGYQPNGDFLALRLDADASELELYQFSQGQPSALSIVQNVPSGLAQWHELQLTVNPGGTHISGAMDGTVFLQADLTSPISGQVGAMSKTDSVDVFDSFTVDPNSGQ